MFVIELVQPTGRCSRPRYQGLFFNTLLTSFVCLCQIQLQALSQRIGHSYYGMVRVHTTSVTGYFRESRHPHIAHLLSHTEIRIDDVFFHLLVDEQTEWVSSTIRIPNPVVGIERYTIVFMNLSVERTEIATILTHADRTLESTIVRRIKYGLFVFCTAFHIDTRQGLVPNVTTDLCQSIDIVVLLFTFQVLLGLLCTDERNTVTEVHLLGTIGKTPYGTSISAFRIHLCISQLAIRQDTRLNRILFRLDIQINVGIVTQLLVSADTLSIGMDSTHTGIHHDIYRLVFLTELDVIDSRLMRQGILHSHVVVIQFGFKRIRGELLLIVSV